MATYDLASSIPSSSTIRGGDILNCSYSGTYKVVTLPQGTYVLEVWGAQGGTGYSSNAGGYGGYAKGTLTLSAATALYVYVGQQGLAYNNSSEATAFGGGGAQEYGSNYDSGGGGGGSDIRISTSLYGRIIVAGGGGGGAGSSSSGYPGAAGGGTTGGIVSTSNGENATITAASQTTYGTNGTSQSYTGLNGAFGVGGSYQGAGSQSGGGGGGGWYGGAAGSYGQAGSGGSGYVYTSSTASNYPSGCLLNSNYYLTSTTMSSGQRAGNGYITITVSSTANDWNYTTSSISAPTYNKQTTSSITLTQSACKCYSFTPTISGPLVMYGAGTQDNYGYLCSSAPVLNTSGQPTSYLTANDDSARLYNGGVSNTSFGFMYNVTAGTTYYLYIKPYSNTTSSQTITVTYWMAHPDARIFIKTDSTTWKQITA